jgi:formate hydrogenlyase subunit 4
MIVNTVQIPAVVFQLTQLLLVVLAAPLLTGWVNQCQAWLQNRSGAGVLQPYRVLHKLFLKDAVIANDASWLFRVTPYVVFGCMWLAAAIIPIIAVDLPFSRAADVIALVGVFALARMFSALAAMDIGTAFGTMGARREMMVSFLAEPALLMVLFTASMLSHSTQLPYIVSAFSQHRFMLYPSLAFAALAFLIVLLAENARIPVDNPNTHLELTMIHEAMVLEYSARHLALIEWASSLKLFAYFSIGIALFLPYGIAEVGHWSALPLSILLLLLKLALAGAGLAFFESLSAKMRIFRAPEFLGTAFLLAVLGLLIHFLLSA